MKLNRSDRISLITRPIPGTISALFFGFGLWCGIDSYNIPMMICFSFMVGLSILVALTMFNDYRIQMAYRSEIDAWRTRALRAELRVAQLERENHRSLHWPGMNVN